MTARDTQIAALVQQSLAAHAQYREACPRMVPNGGGGVMPSPGNPIEARRWLEEAARLRQEAEALDPDLTSLAWDDLAKDLHDFYASELAK